MIVLSPIDANDQLLEAVLDDTTYYIRLCWNDAGKFWSMDIQNAEGEVLVAGIGVVPDSPLLYQFRNQDMPLGDIAVTTLAGGRIGRNSFIDGSAMMVYFEEADLIDAGVLEIYGQI